MSATEAAVRFERGDVSAEVVQDSISHHGVRLLTLQLHYPRMVHGEFMTHRVFSRNAASSRAIPISRQIEYIEQRPAKPARWGKNRAGMQAFEDVDDVEGAEDWWLRGVDALIAIAREGDARKLHKQVVNRFLEPAMFMQTVQTGTEWENYFYLRDDEEADPTIQVLAEVSRLCHRGSAPEIIYPGEWHVPYVRRERDRRGTMRYYDEEGSQLTAEEAKMISASCCAQVSYRRLDTSLEKAEVIFNRLVKGRRLHASALEHTCSPMAKAEWRKRLTAAMLIDDDCALFSGNVRGWRQFRKEFTNENFKGHYVPGDS